MGQGTGGQAARGHCLPLIPPEPGDDCVSLMMGSRGLSVAVQDGTVTHQRDRTLATRALARVEGEGAMHVRVRGSQVDEVRLEIYEPPRFFEAFLRGLSLIHI